MTEKTFKVLSIDGGGVRGILPARFLSLMEAKLGLKIYDEFDLLVGTSTGSIIAAALAVKYDLAQLTEDYEKAAPRIFSHQKCRKLISCRGKICSIYGSGYFRKFLCSKFGNTQLGDIDKPLILNATNASTGDVYVFKSRYQGEVRKAGHYTRDADTPVHQAVLASCAAPTYFDPVNVGGMLVCDGGLWANNPALIGFVEAMTNFSKSPNNIKILSLGTGNAMRDFYRPRKWGWGMMTGWEGTKMVDFVMDVQSKFPYNSLHLMLNWGQKKGNEGILRINPEIQDWGLDNLKSVPILKGIADAEFTKRGSSVMEFLQGEKQ